MDFKKILDHKKAYLIISVAFTIVTGLSSLFANNQTIVSICQHLFYLIPILATVYYVAATFAQKLLEVCSSDVDVKTKTINTIDTKLKTVDNVIQEVNLIKESIATIDSNLSGFMASKLIGVCPAHDKTYLKDADEADDELCKLLIERSSEIKELHIICYGRNGFGGRRGPVQTIIKKHLDIQVKIIVFDPRNYVEIQKTSDNENIRKNIIEWKENSDKIEVFATKIPPMIRAAVAYSEDDNGVLHAIWGKIQAYRFRYDPVENKITPEKYKHSLIAVADERNSTAEDFNMLVQCFTEEFERLQRNSSNAGIDEDGNVVFL